MSNNANKRKPKHPITKIHTGTGSGGFTFLREPMISKDAPICHFVGDLDEACAAIGICSIDDYEWKPPFEEYQTIGERLQFSKEILFIIGAMVHSPANITKYGTILSDYVKAVTITMEISIEKGSLVPLEGFIIPNSINGNFMLARAVVRRAERSAVASEQIWAVPALNAMSDFLFYVSWYISSREEVISQWKGFVD